MASKTERVLTFYRQLLNSLDLVVDDDGLIAFAPQGAVDKKGNPVFQEALVEGRRWCLPVPAILDASPWETHLAFHPLSENFVNEESETLTKLKAAINLKLGGVVGKLLLHLTDFAADPERHGKVSAKASKFLKLVPQLKSISADRMLEIVEKSTLHADRRFVNVYLKKGGMIEGVTYAYAAMVTFPFRKELEGAEPKVFGVTISKKDQASFKALFDFLLPENDELGIYSAGSSSPTAPRMEALLKAYLKLAEVLNDVVEVHRKLLPSYEELKIDTSWEDELSHLRALSDVIPPLPGNIGEAVKDRKLEQGASLKAPAKRLFGQSETRTRREEPAQRVPVVAEPARPAPQAPAPTAVKEAAEDVSTLSFAERQARARQREMEMSRGTYGRLGQTQPEVRGAAYGARQYQPAEPGVPEWAREGATSRVIAGDLDPRDDPRVRHGFVGGAPAAGSFADRMARRQGAGTYGAYPQTSRFSL